MNNLFVYDLYMNKMIEDGFYYDDLKYLNDYYTEITPDYNQGGFYDNHYKRSIKIF